MKTRIAFIPLFFISLFCIISHSTKAQYLDWVKTWDAYVSDMTVDQNGNSYNLINFGTSIDFDPGPATVYLTSFSSQNVAVVKLDALGNFVWVKAIIGTNLTATSIAVDDSTGLYLTGMFRGTLDFDPGSGTAQISSNGTFQNDAFVLKLDTSGTFMWAYGFGNTAADAGHKVITDPDNNVIIGGLFKNTVDFDPGPGISSLNSPVNSSGIGNDIFILKLSPTGTFIWAKSIGNTTFQESFGGLAADNQGNVLISGAFDFDTDFDAGPATVYATFNTDPSVTNRFLCKLDLNGNLQWVKGFSGDGLGISMAATNSDQIIVSGSFRGQFDSDPDAPVNTLTSNGQNDVYVIQLQSNGTFNWSLSFGGSGIDLMYNIHVSTADNIYITGKFNGTCDFDPGPNLASLVSYNNTEDIFLLTLSPSGGFLNVLPFTLVGGNTTINRPSTTKYVNGNLFTCGQFNTTIDFDPGPGTNLVSTGSGFLVKLIGCAPSNYTMNVSACDSYTWIDGNTYNSSTNSPTFILPNSTGCDSIITLNLTINTVDPSATINGYTLMANATNASYQWLDCQNGYAQINGETSQTFVATANGSYAVEVSVNGCTDTSSCLIVSGIGLNELQEALEIVLFPNPTSGAITIQMDEHYEMIELRIFNMKGQIVQEQKFDSALELSVQLPSASGMYLIELLSNGHRKALWKVEKR